jgi:hypothetical protein
MSAKWTFAVYMAGNNNLSDVAGIDLDEMRQVGSSDDVKMCAFIKQADGSGARRLVVTAGGAQDEIEELGDLDSGDPQVVADYFRWVIATAPAERYAFILWNHGGGFRAADLTQLFAEVRGSDAAHSRNALAEVNARARQPGMARALFSTTLKKIIGTDGRLQREILADDGTRHSLDTVELGNVCKALHDELGRPIDLLGMDACLMSNLEVVYQVREHVTHIVGSEREEPGAGWPYELVLADLAANPDMGSAELGDVIVRRYIESYGDQEDQWPVTQSSVATDGVEAVGRAVEKLAGALTATLATDWQHLFVAQSNAVRFTFDLVDVATLARQLQSGGASDAVKAAAKELADVLADGSYVLAESNLGDEVKGCGGVSLYLPPPTNPMSPYYDKLTFSEAFSWDGVLSAYGAAVRGPT